MAVITGMITILSPLCTEAGYRSYSNKYSVRAEARRQQQMERQAQKQQARAEALARREEARKQQAEQPYVIIDQSNDESVQEEKDTEKVFFRNDQGGIYMKGMFKNFRGGIHNMHFGAR